MFAVGLVMSLIGLGVVAGCFIAYHDQTSGTKGKVEVQDCHGHYGRFGSGTVCTGTWVVGGALVGGNGHVVIGQIDNADYDDIGKKINVRFHGSRATKPETRLPIILGACGLLILWAGAYFFWTWWKGAGSAPTDADDERQRGVAAPSA